MIRKEGWMCEKKRSGASPRGYLRPRTGHLRMGVRLPPPPRRAGWGGMELEDGVTFTRHQPQLYWYPF